MALIPTIERVMREGITIDRPYIIPIPDCSLILPTPIGLPLNVNLTKVSVVSAYGSMVVSGLPSINDIIRGRIFPNKITTKIDMKPT